MNDSTMRPRARPTCHLHRLMSSGAKIREVRREDQLQMLQFFHSLCQSDRYSRFGHAATDEWLTRHVFDRDEQRCIAIGVFLDGRLQALGELYISTDGTLGEMAFAVGKGLRGNGVGRFLANYLKRRAIAQGVSRLMVHLRTSNTPMRRVGASAGLFERTPDGGDLEMDTSLA